MTSRKGQVFGFLASLCLCVIPPANGGEVKLKNGLRIAGQVRPLQSLSAVANPSRGPTRIYSVVMVDNGWQRVFVPARQITDDGLDLTAGMSPNGVRPPEVFDVFQQKTSRGLLVQNVGLLSFVGPWSDFGVRRVTLVTGKGSIDVVQGITQIAPDHISITSLTHNWDYGQSLRSVSPVTVDQILRKQINPTQSNDRLALVRFFIEAEYYPQAFRELEQIAEDFPDLAERVNATREELLQLFGQSILAELKRRKAAGQYQLAEEYARQPLLGKLGLAITNEVQEFLGDLNEDRENCQRVALMLGELQAEIDDPKLSAALPHLRSTLLAELSPANLDRLQPFLQNLNDRSIPAAEKLALAYSGWVAGGANAVTELALAIRYWELRHAAVEFLRDGNPQHLSTIASLEGVGPRTVLAAAPLLPLPLEQSGIAPGQAVRVEMASSGDNLPMAYWILLPPEYDPQRNYPCLVALHPGERTAEDMTQFWGGTPDQPGLAQRRGYVVIAPEHTAGVSGEYRYDQATHERVLSTLTHARKKFRLDSDRIFLSGHGTGGEAAIDIALSHPQLFAGVIPFNAAIDHYSKHYRDHARHLAWYFVTGERTGSPQGEQLHEFNAAFWDWMFLRGAFHDVISVQYLGRGVELYPDEQTRLFDWMDLHRRLPPPSEFACETLRETDNRFFWLTSLQLPPTVILPLPAGERRTPNGVRMEGRITPGNTIYLKTPSRQNVLNLSVGQIDEDERVTVRLNERQLFRDFLAPETAAILEELRATGDRQRLSAYRILLSP